MDPGSSQRAEPKAKAPARYLLTGGGTAGHVYPALAIAEAIRERQPDAAFTYLGTRNGAEERIVPSWGIPLLALPVRGLPSGRSPFKLLVFLVLLLLSASKAVRVLLRFKPRAVIGTGGYASAPVFVAAVVLRSLGLWKGVLSLHEQNIVPGRFNQWMSRWADFVGTSFPDSGRCFPEGRTFRTGYPIRKAVLEAGRGDRKEGRERLGIPPADKVMIVFGGSSGARTINEVLLASLPGLLSREDLHIFHATGYPQASYDPEEAWRRARWEPQMAEQVARRYRRTPYLDPMGFYYGIADLVVARSGAGSVWEMVAANVPGLLVPKPGLPGDHQVKNARFLERMGRARVLYETTLPGGTAGGGASFIDPAEFVREVFSLLDIGVDPDSTRSEKYNGGSTFCDVLHAFVEGTGFSAMPNPEPVLPAESCSTVEGKPAAHRPLEWLPPAHLPAVLENRRRRGEALAEPDRRYVRSQIDRLIRSGSWQQRNLAVKLAGLLQDRGALDHLLHCITDRTPAPFLQRVLGGDYRQVGFIRRNALQALWRIRAYDPRVKRALMQALGDPYFEVRSWAARAVLRLCDLVGNDTELEGCLRKNLRDPWFEVVVFSLEPLGEIATDPGILRDVLPLLEHRNWKVQEKAVQCIMGLLARGVVRLDRETEVRMRRIPMKGLDFSPRFSLQNTWEFFLKARAAEEGAPPDPE